MEQFSVVIAVVAGVLTIVNLIDKIIAWVKALKQPQNDLESRVTKLEKTVEFEYKSLLAEYEIRFKNDYTRLNRIEKGNKLTQRSLLALIRHAESGNNVEELKKVAEELNDFIWESEDK